MVPEVKQTRARSSGAGGCNQIRREKMNRVATGNDKTLNFGTPSSSPDSEMIRKDEVILLVLVPTHHWFNVVVFSQSLLR